MSSLSVPGNGKLEIPSHRDRAGLVAAEALHPVHATRTGADGPGPAQLQCQRHATVTV